MQRRDLLTLLSRSAALLALGSLFGADGPQARAPAFARPRFTGYPFTLGVASGMPRPHSVVLWTRLAPDPYAEGGGLPGQPLAVRWELAEDAHFRHRVRAGEAVAQPAHAHSVHVEVQGLDSGRTYYYRFMSGDAVSPIGRTRTAPAEHEPVRRLRLALASCQHYEQGHYAVHREIAARDLDFVLFVGDYIYETSHPDHMVRAHEGPTPTRLDTYRRRHATYKLDPHLRAAHAAHPWVLTWDDHEVENDYAGEHSWFDLDTASFLRRRAAAYKAYFEHMPVSPAMAPQGPAMRIHDRYTWGQLAELWTLDTRQYRSIPACSPHPRLSGGRLLHRCAELVDDRRSLLGAEQERWLAAGLHRSTRAWKLLAQSTQISPWGVDTPVGRSVYSDSWDGYPRARERLLAGIAEAGVRDVVTLGGDVHRHVAAQLRLRPNDPRSPVVASEFVTTSVTSRGLPESVMGVIRYANPDLVHARSDERGYALVEFTPASARCEFRATAHPVAQDARLHTQAAYAVERGRAGVQRDR
ncbi:alkaline phosphatase D family protein [Caldimonas thermodepolymerans]|uniref:Alkaline phosphatase D n=1 Tax=Caldimonas thermodepolymerans TaxID=215580 RepID=A0AA46HWB7_9BURK|nr:alkaline phosphatase D family protein [Caldimonas thermodepolymerans]TCP07744.1 alkaline phosphatase D [Caldimonas thermodepolymerans]UZG47909.1 alkaline phosphatase D family protein [Caldimonas thermodepolymerans]